MAAYKPYVIGVEHYEPTWSSVIEKVKKEIDERGRKGMTIAIEIGSAPYLYPLFWHEISGYARLKGMNVVPLESNALRRFTLEKLGLIELKADSSGVRKISKFLDGSAKKKLPRGLKLRLGSLRNPSFVKKVLKKKPDMVVTGYGHAFDIKAAIPSAVVKPIPAQIAKQYAKTVKILEKYRRWDWLELKLFRAKRRIRKIGKRLKRKVI